MSIGQERQSLKSIKDSADKLVILFWGKENFEKYIKLDNSKSMCWGQETYMRTSLDKDINFTPNSYRFHYNVIHKVFYGDTASIEFNIDSIGKLDIFNSVGFYQPGGDLNKLKTIPPLQAIRKAKSLGLTKGKTKWIISLVWIETDPSSLNLKPNSSLKDFIKGHYCWAIKSTLTHPYRIGCFVYTHRVYYFDIISGKLIDKKDFFNVIGERLT